MKAAQSGLQIDQLVRSKRRTISLEISRDGRLIVRAPLRTPMQDIQSLVNSKQSWIIKKRSLVLEQSRVSPPKRFVHGEQFLYLGEVYRLAINQNQNIPLVLNAEFHLAAKMQPDARRVFESWYRERAAEFINPRTAALAQQNGFSFSKIRITGAMTRWGSCGPKGSLNFTWRLVMAPIAVIDYVIIHELVHLRIRSHSRRYWDSVRGFMPDYQIHRDWLRANGHRLTLD